MKVFEFFPPGTTPDRPVILLSRQWKISYEKWASTLAFNFYSQALKKLNMIDEVVFTFSFLFPHFFDVAKVIFSWICHLLGDGTNLSRNYAFCRSISQKFHALKKLHNFNTIKYKSDCCKHNRTHHKYLATINSLKNLRMWLLPKILSLNKIIIRQIIYFLKS